MMRRAAFKSPWSVHFDFSSQRSLTVMFGINFAFDFAIDQKLLLELDRAFDFDVAGKDVFAGMFSHKLFVIVC